MNNISSSAQSRYGAFPGILAGQARTEEEGYSSEARPAVPRLPNHLRPESTTPFGNLLAGRARTADMYSQVEQNPAPFGTQNLESDSFAPDDFPYSETRPVTQNLEFDSFEPDDFPYSETRPVTQNLESDSFAPDDFPYSETRPVTQNLEFDSFEPDDFPYSETRPVTQNPASFGTQNLESDSDASDEFPYPLRAASSDREVRQETVPPGYAKKLDTDSPIDKRAKEFKNKALEEGIYLDSNGNSLTKEDMLPISNLAYWKKQVEWVDILKGKIQIP